MLTLDGPIEAVTVYRRAAVVTRRAEAGLSAGAHELEIVGLPLSLLDASLRVEATTEGGAAVRVAQVRVGLYVAPREQLPEPPDEAERREVQRELERLRRRLELARSEQHALRALQAPDRPRPEPGQAPGPSPVAARLALDSFVMETVAEHGSEAHRLEDEIQALERREADLEQRVRLASTAQRVDAKEVSKSAVCRLGLDAAAQVSLRVSYQVPGTRWAPTYQVRVTDDRAEIVLRAFICQRTGEDWSNARLSVSTADPVFWTALPKMTALRIGREQPDEAPAIARSRPEGADALFADYDGARQRLSPPTRRRYARALPPLSEPDRAPLLAPPSVEERYDEADEADGGAVLMSMPAPELAPAAAAPAAYQVPAAEEVYGDVASAKGRAARGFGAAEAASEGERPRRRKRSALARQQDAAGAPPAPAPPPLPMLDELVLRGPQDRQRGALTPLDRPAEFRAALSRAGRSVAGMEPARLVSDAVRAAETAAAAPLPPAVEPPSDAAGHFDYTYPAHGPVDVPSDGALHSVPLSVRSGPCALTYVTVPRVDTAVYRQAELINPEASPLLPGPAEIYVDGTYVLTAGLPKVPGRGELQLGLGVEQAIRCARNTRFREARSSDKVVATNDLYHELRYTLANDLDRPVQIEVRERVPVPGEDAEVVVEERDVAPPWTAYAQKERQARIKGGRRWRVTVPAGQEQQLQATYVVRIYANHQIAGGNRRER